MVWRREAKSGQGVAGIRRGGASKAKWHQSAADSEKQRRRRRMASGTVSAVIKWCPAAWRLGGLGMASALKPNSAVPKKRGVFYGGVAGRRAQHVWRVRACRENHHRPLLARK